MSHAAFIIGLISKRSVINTSVVVFALSEIRARN